MSLFFYSAIFMRIGYAIILILGGVICKRHSFREGFYFFLTTLMLYINWLVAPYYIQRITQYEGSLTVGNLMFMLAYFQEMVQVAITSVLIWGLYKRFRRA